MHVRESCTHINTNLEHFTDERIVQPIENTEKEFSTKKKIPIFPPPGNP